VTLPSDAFRHVASRAHEPLRTFHPRRATLGRDRERAHAHLWPRFGFTVHDDALGRAPLRADGSLDVAALFGRAAPLVLEIGSGMGETTVAMAAADPSRDYLAVEAHLPGVANLLVLIERAALTNVRVAHGDALDLVRRHVPEGTLDAVHVFFPDPWPKARHHKRRLIQPAHVALLRSRLTPGGTMHCATDWAEYAESMRETLTADPELVDVHGGYAPRPAHRPVTKFERRALTAGRDVFDLVHRRRA
jgi:tRNA (guanine-N7-)-methyltransferase